jgi:hypothetical protein
VGLVEWWWEGVRGPAFHKPTGGWEGGARGGGELSTGGAMKKATARSLVLKSKETLAKEEAVTTNRMKLVGQIRKWLEEDAGDMCRFRKFWPVDSGNCGRF